VQQTGGRLIRELNRHAEVVMEAVPQNMADDAATAAADLEKARKAAMAEPRALDAGAAAAGYEDQHQRGGSGLEDLRATPEDGFSVLTIQVCCQAAGQALGLATLCCGLHSSALLRAASCYPMARISIQALI